MAMWLWLARNSQQHVQALGLGHEGGRAQQVLDVEAVAVLLEDQRQQVLGEQDAEHVVVAFADHRVARVRGVDHRRQELAGDWSP
jgi:UTP-glucose-1-phosphate uridylyltransferase